MAEDAITGKVEVHSKESLIVVSYDLQYNGGCADSLRMSLYYSYPGPDSILRQSSEWVGLTVDNAVRSDSCGSIRWRGHFELASSDQKSYTDCVVEVYGVNEKGAVEKLMSDEFAVIGPSGYGRRAMIGLGFPSYSEFDKPLESTDKKVLWRIEDKWMFHSPRASFIASWSLNLSKPLVWAEYPRVGGELALFGRDKGLPIVEGYVVHSRLRVKHDTVTFVKRDVGSEMAVRLEGPFESIRYAYNSGIGGYNRVDVLVARWAKMGGYKIGTGYTLIHGKNLRMVGISVAMEGWGIGNEPIEYKNRRPFVHKVIGLAAWIPFLPLAMLMAGSS